MVLFAVLPFGVRTQDEEGDVDARHRCRARRASRMLRAQGDLSTTIVAAIVIGAYLRLLFERPRHRRRRSSRRLVPTMSAAARTDEASIAAA